MKRAQQIGLSILAIALCCQCADAGGMKKGVEGAKKGEKEAVGGTKKGAKEAVGGTKKGFKETKKMFKKVF